MISSKYILKKLKEHGWLVVAIKGSHYQLQHPTKKGKVTIMHPKKDFKIGTIKSIENQSGVKLI